MTFQRTLGHESVGTVAKHSAISSKSTRSQNIVVGASMIYQDFYSGQLLCPRRRFRHSREPPSGYDEFKQKLRYWSSSLSAVTAAQKNILLQFPAHSSGIMGFWSPRQCGCQVIIW